MSYKDTTYSEEEDTISDYYRTNNTQRTLKRSNNIDNSVIDDLNKLAKKNDIKGLRNYINLNRQALRKYKSRLLNNNVPINGYKFVRRDDKLMLLKFSSPTTHEPKTQGIELANTDTFANDEYESTDGCLKRSKTDFYDNVDSANRSFTERSEATRQFEASDEGERNEAKASISTSQKKPLNEQNEGVNNKELTQESYNKLKIQGEVLPNKPTPMNPKNNVEPNNYFIKEGNKNGSINENANQTNNNSTTTLSNSNYGLNSIQNNDNLTSILNSLTLQANKQNETQKQQYEQLTKTLSDSITAKNEQEQERINKLNNCVDVIERTFSAGTFDRIIESIDNMVQTLTNKNQSDVEQIKENINMLNVDIEDLITKTNTLKSIVESQPRNNEQEIENLINQQEAQDETIEELRERIQEQEDEITKLNENNTKSLKQYGETINKIMLCLYNAVDDELFNRVFNGTSTQQNQPIMNGGNENINELKTGNVSSVR